MNIPEEAIAAFQEAWEAKRKEIGRGIAPKGTKTKAGLTAALPHIRAQIANEISDAAITLTSGSIAEVARSVQRQAARTAEKGTTK